MHDIINTLGECGVVPDIIRITDIGALATGTTEQWKKLIDRGRASLLGFEPQQQECDRCNAMTGEGHHYLPFALGDGTTRPFHLCRVPQTSSFYRPNGDVVSRFDGLAYLMEVIKTETIETKRLDDIEEARETDFLKLDVQGAELEILSHANEVLKDVSMIQTEACFIELYQGQPLFADIDQFMRARGFELYTVLGFGSRMRKPLSPADLPDVRPRQTLWSDVVYLKSASLMESELGPMSHLKRAVLLHELYDACDFAARDLQDYDRLTGHHSLPAYASMLRQRQAV